MCKLQNIHHHCKMFVKLHFLCGAIYGLKNILGGKHSFTHTHTLSGTMPIERCNECPPKWNPPRIGTLQHLQCFSSTFHCWLFMKKTKSACVAWKVNHAVLGKNGLSATKGQKKVNIKCFVINSLSQIIQHIFKNLYSHDWLPQKTILCVQKEYTSLLIDPHSVGYLKLEFFGCISNVPFSLVVNSGPFGCPGNRLLLLFRKSVFKNLISLRENKNVANWELIKKSVCD